MTRDFAFVVARDVAAGDILRAAQGAERQLIAGIDVFDVYEGQGIDPDKKSVAIAVTLQPTEKTLTDAEIEAVSQKIVAEVAKKTGAVLQRLGRVARSDVGAASSTGRRLSGAAGAARYRFAASQRPFRQVLRIPSIAPSSQTASRARRPSAGDRRAPRRSRRSRG